MSTDPAQCHRAVLIPGDGIGPEVTEAALRVVARAGVRIEWERHQAGADLVHSHGSALPGDVIEAIRHVGVALKGPIGSP